MTTAVRLASREIDPAHEGLAGLSAGRQRVVDATADLETAKDAVAAAERAHGLALETAKAADARRQAQDEADQAAASDLAERIKFAAASGDELKATLPASAKAIARGDAEAEAAAADRAVAILAAELEAARTAVVGAEEAQRLATMAVVAEVAEDVVAEMRAAFAALERGLFNLFALEAAAYTLTSAGMRRLAFTNEGRRFLRWEFMPRSRPGNAATVLAGRWRAWRDSLVADPAAEPPEDE